MHSLGTDEPFEKALPRSVRGEGKLIYSII